jgi:hypothetical protein
MPLKVIYITKQNFGCVAVIGKVREERRRQLFQF